MNTRTIQREDLSVLAAAGLDTRPLLAPHTNVQVALDPALVGFALWYARPLPQPAYLAAVVINAGAPPGTIHHLALACAIQAQNDGYTDAVFTINNRTLHDALVSLYAITPEPTGVDPHTREPHSWEQTVEIAIAIPLLQRLISEGPP